MFRSERPKGKCESEQQTRTRARTCSGGRYGAWGDWSPWSGSFAADKCTSGCDGGFGDGDRADSETQERTMFLDSTPSGGPCKSETQRRERHRRCVGGSLSAWSAWSAWSGSYTKESCAAGCALGGAAYAHGAELTEKRVRYESARPSGMECKEEAQVRSAQCSDGKLGAWGTWSGSFTAEACEDGCVSPSKAHGETRYERRMRCGGDPCECAEQVRSSTRLYRCPVRRLLPPCRSTVYTMVGHPASRLRWMRASATRR